MNEAKAKDLVQKILKDLSDRAGIPEWLGDLDDNDTISVVEELTELVVLETEGD